MKKNVLFYLLLPFVLLGISCGDDDTNELPPVPIPDDDCLIDAYGILNLDMTCEDNSLDSIKCSEFSKFSDFQLQAAFKWGVFYDKSLTAEQSSDVYKAEYAYYVEKSAFIIDAYNKAVLDPNGVPSYACPCFFTGYIDGDVTITCDKKLFDKEPGEDLSDYFTVSGTSPCIPIGRENPYLLYGFTGPLETFLGNTCTGNVIRNMKDFFVKDTWLQTQYCLRVAEEPKEEYEEVTFYVTMPIAREFSARYITSLYLGTNQPLEISNDTCRSECTVKFSSGNSL